MLLNLILWCSELLLACCLGVFTDANWRLYIWWIECGPPKCTVFVLASWIFSNECLCTNYMSDWGAYDIIKDCWLSIDLVLEGSLLIEVETCQYESKWKIRKENMRVQQISNLILHAVTLVFLEPHLIPGVLPRMIFEHRDRSKLWSLPNMAPKPKQAGEKKLRSRIIMKRNWKLSL